MLAIRDAGTTAERTVEIDGMALARRELGATEEIPADFGGAVTANMDLGAMPEIESVATPGVANTGGGNGGTMYGCRRTMLRP